MSYHYSNFGQFSDYVVQYADLNGYVPEAGDDPENFTWPHEGYEGDEWEDFVQQAIAATEEAEEALKEWREDDE